MKGASTVAVSPSPDQTLLLLLLRNLVCYTWLDLILNAVTSSVEMASYEKKKVHIFNGTHFPAKGHGEKFWVNLNNVLVNLVATGYCNANSS